LYRHLLAALALAILLAAAACSDLGGGSDSGPAASGETGLLRSGGDSVEIETKPVGAVEKGVVPDLVGTALGEAQAAIKEAGFKEGGISGGIGVGTVFPPTLEVCSQEPEAGSTPKKNTEVDLVAKQTCD
jgi:hypothetical protein